MGSNLRALVLAHYENAEELRAPKFGVVRRVGDASLSCDNKIVHEIQSKDLQNITTYELVTMGGGSKPYN